jgi:hypothetical protein
MVRGKPYPNASRPEGPAPNPGKNAPWNMVAAEVIGGLLVMNACSVLAPAGGFSEDLQ